MPDQQLGRRPVGAQILSRGNQIVDVGREVGVGELAAAVTKSGEVEPEHGDAALGQRARDALCGENIFGTGKAVGEEGIGPGLTRGQVEPRR